jgi:succinate dehydrogenase/fumarate reductase cytochrome b subunit
MNATLLKALLLFLPVSLLFCRSTALFVREKAASSFLQLFGAGCLVMVVFTHICEAFRLFPWMQWGLEHSAGHYLDLSCAVLGLTLFPIGYVFRALTRRKA